MVINFKDRFYVLNSDEHFSEEDIRKLLEAAYDAGHKDGYDAGYSAGIGSRVVYPYYPYQPYYWNSPTCPNDYTTITCNNPTSTSTISNPATSTTTWAKCKAYEEELKNGRN